MDVAFCHICVTAEVTGLQTLCLNKDEAFVTRQIEIGNMQ